MKRATLRTLLLSMLCGACASDPARVETSTQTVTVYVPQPVPCIEAAKIPAALALTNIDPDKADVRQNVDALAADAIAAKQAADAARALLIACAQPAKEPTP